MCFLDSRSTYYCTEEPAAFHQQKNLSWITACCDVSLRVSRFFFTFPHVLSAAAAAAAAAASAAAASVMSILNDLVYCHSQPLSFLPLLLISPSPPTRQEEQLIAPEISTRGGRKGGRGERLFFIWHPPPCLGYLHSRPVAIDSQCPVLMTNEMTALHAGEKASFDLQRSPDLSSFSSSFTSKLGKTGRERLSVRPFGFQTRALRVVSPPSSSPHLPTMAISLLGGID